MDGKITGFIELTNGDKEKVKEFPALKLSSIDCVGLVWDTEESVAV